MAQRCAEDGAPVEYFGDSKEVWKESLSFLFDFSLHVCWNTMF